MHSQRLEVKDALSYLDKVKVEFGDQPHIYNRFLDIMKDFKSAAIDTPGVIQRVSALFRDYPSLIVGFNAFLPQGYRIEILPGYGQDDHRVSISTPSGHSHIIGYDGHVIAEGLAPGSLPPGPGGMSEGGLGGHHGVGGPPFAHMAGASGPPSMGPQQQRMLASMSPGGAPPPGFGGQVLNSGAQPLEFSHAISYVNKIKNRFVNQPDVYKQFLEILHTYQKQQRTMKEGGYALGPKTLSENEVYQQVARLFHGQEDLLREFSQFLPDAVTGALGMASLPAAARDQLGHLAGGLSMQMQQAGSGMGRGQAPSGMAIQQPSSPPGSSPPTQPPNFGPQMAGPCANTPPTAAPPPQGQLISGAQQPQAQSRTDPPPLQPIPLKGTGGEGGRLQASVDAGVQQQQTASTTTALKDHQPAKTSAKEPKAEKGVKRSATGPDEKPAPPVKRPRMTIRYDVSYAEAAKYGTLNEYQFFDKVRRALRNDEVYENFLRCLILFNKELISKLELIQILTPFLGKFPELLKWLRDFLGCPETGGFVEHIPRRAVAPQITSDLAMEIDYATCKQYGASYRALPPSYKQPVCSGRTKLCDEVLNDIWVSFPSWSSEDTTTVSAKKTQYEEYIYRTEDERFELDIVIEMNRSTIHVLEGVRQRIEQMPLAERGRFRLDDTLGGRSAVTHLKAIRRIYGDKAQDVIEAVKRNPATALPIVIKRMKAKDEEWREAQKQFNKIWREQMERFYLKSLDHQALIFKQNDLKLCRSKALLNQIEVLYDERHESIEEGVSEVPTGPHMMVVYPMDVNSVFTDVTDLLIHHVKRQASLSHEEKSDIKRLLRDTLPDLFNLERGEQSDDEDEGLPEDEGSSVSSENSSVRQSRTRTRRQKQRAKPVSKRDVKSVDYQKVEDSETCGYSLSYVPNCWYVFLRLHCTICERLNKLHACALALSKEEVSKRTQAKNSTAERLQLRAKKQVAPSDYYTSLLEGIKNLLDGQVDSSIYEDQLRDMFTIEAYLAFTLDKIIQTMVRQLQLMVTEETCLSILRLQEYWWRQGGAGGPRALTDADERQRAEDAYQRAAEGTLVDQNCFKTFFFYPERRVTFELLDTDSYEADEETESPDHPKQGGGGQGGKNGGPGTKAGGPPPPDPARANEHWSDYVHDYINTLPSLEQSMEYAKTEKPLFLQRNLRLGLRTMSNLKAQVKSSPTGEEKEKTATPTEPEAEKTETDEGTAETSAEEKKPASEEAVKSVRGENEDKEESEEGVGGVGVVVVDGEEAVIGPPGPQLKARKVQGTGFIMAKPNSCQRARQAHQSITESRYSRLQAFLNKWLHSNAKDEQMKLIDDWLLLGNQDQAQDPPYTVNRVEIERLNQSPYRLYYRFLSPS